jgi:hypothetical protein
MDAVLLLNAVATWTMVGVIWVVQGVHYALFAEVGAPGFAAYHRAHNARISRVVVVPMLVEALTAALLVAAPPEGVPRWLAAVGLALVAAVWWSTWWRVVPGHRRLAGGFDAAAHAGLMRANRTRAVLWTAHGAVVAAMLALALGA